MSNNNIIDNTSGVIKDFDGAVERALIKCGVIAEGYAKLKCPVDTGRLRGSIVYATSTSGSQGQSPAEPGDYTPLEVPQAKRVYIGTNVEYAPDVELGTQRQRAQPFLRPAIENHINEYKQTILDELRGGE